MQLATSRQATNARTTARGIEGDWADHIGKAQMAVTIRVPSDKDPARRMQETRTFGTTKREVLALADWLRAWQVPGW